VSRIDLESLSDDELREVAERAPRLLAEREKQRRHAVLEEVKAKLAGAGLSLRDLSRSHARKGRAESPAAPIVNPDDPSQTWTPGRGRRPKWATGKKR